MSREQEQAYVQARQDKPAAPATGVPAPPPAALRGPAARQRTRVSDMLWLVTAGLVLTSALLALRPTVAPALRNTPVVPDVQNLVSPKEKVYKPSLEEPKPGSVEADTEFNDFALLIDSRPDDAQVLVDGVDQGRTPMAMTPQCKLGSTLILELRKSGYKPYVHTTPCRTERMVRVSATLQRLGKSHP
jgi:hypothetical protein